jgi:hypothetical protein
VLRAIVGKSNAALNYHGFGLLFGLCYAGLLMNIVLSDFVLRRFLSRPRCRLVGQVSYSIYLVHFPLMQHVVMRLAARAPSGLALVTAIVGSVSGRVPRRVWSLPGGRATFSPAHGAAALAGGRQLRWIGPAEDWSSEVQRPRVARGDS